MSSDFELRSASFARRRARLAVGLLLILAAALPIEADHVRSAPEPREAQRPAGSEAPPNLPDSSQATALRVCADPNNLPFSNRAGEGFENALAELIAADLKRTVEYTWWPQRRGFMRTTLNAGICDVVMGVPAAFEMSATTAPYYRSAYALVTRRDRRLRLTSLDDPRLRMLRIGVHVVGDDYASVPPAQALANRKIVDNVRGYSIYGDYAKPNPPADLIDAVRAGDIDVAIAWGPFAGYFAASGTPALEVTPLPDRDRTGVQLAFDIAMGVRRADRAFEQQLDEVLARRQPDIRALLSRYHIVRVQTATNSR
jgi:quinoprotein dehydrogenase-associated probable ABC transporter substrate-binding protein